MRRVLRQSVGLLWALLFLPAVVAAQAAITGVVKDSSGAVLPGVTVEAASPVLIEKIRSAISDATGQYRIVNLLPGTYSVTFSLTGFSAFKREGIELTGEFVATVNADLKVGDLEEAITVTGETPIVDVQSARLQQTVNKDIITAIPSARTNAGLQQLIPGLIGNNNSLGDVGGASGRAGGGAGSIHGGRMYDSRAMNDGLTIGHAGGAGGGGSNANVAGSQEVVISTSGGLGEAETSGVIVNLVPRDGTNTYSGSVFWNGANGAMQGSNYTQALKDAGLRAPSEIIKVYDFNAMGGGRIIRDRLWFFLTERVWGADNSVPGIFVNKNAGNLNAWTYDPDFSRQAFTDAVNKTHIARLTWQVSPRNKVAVFWNEQFTGTNQSGGGNATQTIEATGSERYIPSRQQQATWQSPISNRFLAEAGVGTYFNRFGSGWLAGGPRADGSFPQDQMHLQMRVQEQGGIVPGLNYRSPGAGGRNKMATRTWRASLSYVTGAHNMKFGYFGGFISPSTRSFSYHPITAYRFNNGVPNQISVNGNYPNETEIERNLVPTSFYAQEQWTGGKLTLQGGVRYDRMLTTYPDSRVGGTPLIPTEIFFPSRSTQGIDWHDITPRIGVAYDLFGTGKTALKFSLGKYVESYVASIGFDLDQSPIARATSTTTRPWTDRNRDYVVDCDLVNPDTNGECGDMANKNLGSSVNRTFDRNLITGWGNRPNNWELGMTVQQQLTPRISVSVGYFRRWFGNWWVTDNLANSLSDWTEFGVVAPVDPRLPGGGGYPINGLYDLVQAKVGLVEQYTTPSSTVADQTERWHGVDLLFNVRSLKGITVQGGLSTGRRFMDNCAIRALLPELGQTGTRATENDGNPPVTINFATPVSPYCRVDEPFLTMVRGLTTYTIPKVDVQVSATFQSNPGPQLSANYVMSNALVMQTLGRPLSGGAANITVNLIPSGTLYGDRINTVDFRIAKLLRFGRTRSQFGIDIYNLTNTDTPTSYNNTFVPGGQWLTPTSVTTARFVKVGMQVDF